MMWNTIKDVFIKPDDDADPYIWDAAFSLVSWVILINITASPLSATRWSIYLFFFWQMAQFCGRRTKECLIDCFLNLVAWASVSLGLFEIWINDPINALIYIGGAFMLMMVRVVKKGQRRVRSA